MSILCLALLTAFQDDSRALVPPAGWRGEHLEFPLSFAPELPYRGSEDLAFAPGMFEPESDSYFSYAMALRLEDPAGGAPDLDAPELAAFLETYYRGLCQAVAEGRKLELDADAVRARVRRDGDALRATVEMFDPFTSGAPLLLELELFVHHGPRASEVLGLASALARDKPIWDELTRLAQTWRAARPAAVYLNHAYAVVDEETYAALAGSTFLREAFAVTEERTTVRADLSYSGLYLYGVHTYLEFLPPSAAAGLVAERTGLAFGLEAEGGLAAFEKRLGTLLAAQRAPITRQLEAEAVPWFEILGLQMPSGPLDVFAMEYDPRFLERWHAGLAPPTGGRTRAAVLERYAAALQRSAQRASVPFEDVREIRLTLDEEQEGRVLSLCEAAGFEIDSGVEGTRASGPHLRLLLTRAAEPGGITSLALGLRRPLEREPLRLGRVTLSFEGTTAWVRLHP